MLYKTTLRLLLAFAIVSSTALAQQKTSDRSVPDVERLRAHITYLASDKLEGRRTGTPGAEEAARYVADEFKRPGAARAAGAKALVVIAREDNFKDDKLTALKYDNAGGDAGLSVVAVSRQVAAKILGIESPATLTKIEQATTLWAAKVVEAVSKYN